MTNKIDRPNATRRQFLSAGAACVLSLTAHATADAVTRKRLLRRRGPAVHTPKRGNPPVVVGENEHRYEVEHDWPQLPADYSWQTTHNVGR